MAINSPELTQAPPPRRESSTAASVPTDAAKTAQVVHPAPRTGAIRRVSRGLAYRWDRQVMARLRVKARQFAARHAWAARWYYALFSRAFLREQHAVLAGIAEYDATATNAAKNAARLRRNTHGLEKGLSMQPRRAVFGTDYIADTMESLAAALDDEEKTDNDPGLVWALAVLREYFSVTSSHPVIDTARAQFEKIEKARVLFRLSDS